jgi:hypothetical protein
MRNQFGLVLMGLFLTSAWAQLPEQRSTLADQTAVAITIYNNDLALVKDHRKIELMHGVSSLAFRDVSAKMRPETALLRSLAEVGSVSVLEQNFDFDLLTPQSLLNKYVGQTVNVVRTHPQSGLETSEKATVLASSNGVVLKIGQRIETGIPGRLVFDEVPANLRERPTLVMRLDNSGATQQNVALSYLTAGLSWKADYVVELNNNDDKLDISGWVTLTNTSGATYRNAKLQLVAGDVNRVMPQLQRNSMVMLAAPAPSARVASMAEESLFEYHLYTLNSPTTVAENQTKQVALLSAAGVPARKEFLLRGSDYYYQSSVGDLGQKIKIAVFIEFENHTNAHLGMPLPKGIIRVYKNDTQGNVQFIGEDSVDHTPKNEKVRLKLGDAFDVTADKRQTEFKKVTHSGKFSSAFESAYEVVLKNAKKEAVTVTVQEPMPGEWQVLSENLAHSKGSSNTAVWKVRVPPESSSILTYRVLVRY